MDLPADEQEPFREWLFGQTVPFAETDKIHDRYYPWDYRRWKAGLAVID
jgi:hypothetical protein